MCFFTSSIFPLWERRNNTGGITHRPKLPGPKYLSFMSKWQIQLWHPKPTLITMREAELLYIVWKAFWFQSGLQSTGLLSVILKQYRQVWIHSWRWCKFSWKLCRTRKCYKIERFCFKNSTMKYSEDSIGPSNTLRLRVTLANGEET